MAGKYHVGRYGGLIWHNWYKGMWMHKQSVRLVQVEVSKRLGSDQLETNNGHNHAERQSTIESGMKVI